MSDLTTRTVTTVTFESAQALVSHGIRAAKEAGVAASVVVVDRSGEIVAAGRADSGSVLSLEVATHKAWTAANVGAPTDAIAQFVASDPNAVVYMQSMPRFVAIAGGLPLIIDGVSVGAIGVSGGSSELDAEIASAALRELGL